MHLKLCCVLIASLLSLSLLGQDHAVYYLQKNESISELLYNRLKISPIYGKDKFLEQILEYNKLTFKKARVLSVGHPVYVPHMLHLTPEVTTEPPPETENVHQPVSETLPTEPSPTISTRHEIALKGGFYSYRGKSNEGSDFSSTGPIAGVQYKFIINRDTWDYVLSSDVQYLCLDCSKRNEHFLTGNIGVSALKSFSGFFIGPGFEIARNIFIQENNLEDVFLYGVVPKAFISFGHIADSYKGSIKLGQNFESSLSNGSDVDPAPFANVALTFVMKKKLDMGFELHHEKRKVNDFDQSFSILQFLASWKFD